jgi:hypothetical protein
MCSAELRLGYRNNKLENKNSIVWSGFIFRGLGMKPYDTASIATFLPIIKLSKYFIRPKNPPAIQKN